MISSQRLMNLSMNRRLVVVANDLPYPPNSGGRVDVWRRLHALKAIGCDVMLICWVDADRKPEPMEQALAALYAVCNEVRVFEIARSLQEIGSRLTVLWKWPSHVASRWVTCNLEGLKAESLAFGAEAVLLDGLYGGAVALDLARGLNLPLFYRSHNVEHVYMRLQHHRLRFGARWLGLAANRLNLRGFERRVLKAARRVFDISHEDREFWRSRGFENVDWLPPIVDESFASSIANLDGDQAIDILYFGNLHTPNNVEAVRWLLLDVLPHLPNQELRVCIAGSLPCSEVRELVDRDARVELIADPDNIAALVCKARVLVNPVLASSGVNLKSVEMLFGSAQLVSTSPGVRGLPDDVRECFLIADDAKSFAQLIESTLELDRAHPGDRLAARLHFGTAGVGNQLAEAIFGQKAIARVISA